MMPELQFPFVLLGMFCMSLILYGALGRNKWCEVTGYAAWAVWCLVLFRYWVV